MTRPIKPVRLQLSREKGFNLQTLSHEVNGLDAVNVARPSRWGNPFKVGAIDRRTGGYIDAESAVEKFLNALVCENLPVTEGNVGHFLGGKNLACWCKPGEPCHADVLLELANGSPLLSSQEEAPSQISEGKP